MAGDSTESLFEGIITDIDAEMRAIRAEQTVVAPLLWQVVDYQFGWDLPPDQRDQFRKISGKKARPLLMALVARAICGQYRHVLPAGAALEFIHNFTLIHDDVMDKSFQRRHRPTVWAQWGSAQAINAGDGLYALANLSVMRLVHNGTSPDKVVRAARALSQACLWTAEGQILDMDYETRGTVTTADYLIMVEHKTGTLIEAAAAIGALLSTDDDTVIQGYARFARHLGIAFQIRDDYLGVWGDETKLGKSTTSDIREKKKAYPLLAALERAPEADRAALRQWYAQETLSDADVRAVTDLFERVGAAEHTDRIAREYFDSALDHLESTGIKNETQDMIRRYAAFLVQRSY